MCQCTGNCGCSAIVLEQSVGPQGEPGSSTSATVIDSNYNTSSTHAAGVETVMLSQLINDTDTVLTVNGDKINLIAWFTGPVNSDTVTFRLRQNTTAVVAGAQELCNIQLQSKAYRLKFHVELTRLSASTYRVEGEIFQFGSLTGNNTFAGGKPVFSGILTSPSSLLLDFYLFGTIESTSGTDTCSMDHFCVESKKKIV